MEYITNKEIFELPVKRSELISYLEYKELPLGTSSDQIIRVLEKLEKENKIECKPVIEISDVEIKRVADADLPPKDKYARKQFCKIKEEMSDSQKDICELYEIFREDIEGKYDDDKCRELKEMFLNIYGRLNDTILRIEGIEHYPDEVKK